MNLLVGHWTGELWDPNRGWKLDQFADYLPPLVLEKIAAVEVFADDGADDHDYWGYSENGKFSINSAICLIRGNSDGCIDPIWTIIWKAQIPQRFRALVWLICHAKVLPNVNRAHIHFTTFTLCSICGDSAENFHHIFRACMKAMDIWNWFRSRGMISLETEPNLRTWILNNLTLTVPDPNWLSKFYVILWWIWR